ncbi:class I tRNA ligase family protein [Algoriphagus sp.]|uniref:class I tRNA ligase family protein n=1 Tax=Algoriphagus sp. TaxID=1872435 RepID=UPI0026175AC7|nr:class I tRNA ligase family protein [Algoriphagus sp.]
MGQKKCPHCEKWSRWNMNLTDPCEHCGQPLGGKDLKNQERREQEQLKNTENWLFTIKKTDSSLLVFLKKIGNSFYTIFMAILSFLLWLIAVMPG